jgi:hypothetical protein
MGNIKITSYEVSFFQSAMNIRLAIIVDQHIEYLRVFGAGGAWRGCIILPIAFPLLKLTFLFI